MTDLDLRLRPFAFNDADYDAMVAIDQLAWPGEPLSPEALRHDDQSWEPHFFFERVLVERSSTPIAYAQASETPWSYQPNKYFLKIMVLPDEQGRGLGTWLYEHMAAKVLDRGATLLTATTREDQPQALHFLAKRGFRQTIRELESRLDVAACDLHTFAPICEQVRQSGISIMSIGELQSLYPDWRRTWWQLTWQIIPDMPTSEAFTPETLEQFAEGLQSPQIDFEAAFVAIDTATNEWVGMSSVLVYPETPETLYVGNTGVLRAYRRRQIALALKVATIAYAQRIGAEEIIGENEENNPMYQLNLKLGFRYSHAWLGFEKVLA
jgi:GNAT superfamily N-acetyltransferase